MSQAIDSSIARRGAGPTFGMLATVLIVLLIVSLPLAWLAQTHYGVSHLVASNSTWIVFNLAYIGILILPWLPLNGQRDLTRSKRLEKMCIAWICLTTMPHLLTELPWVVFYHAIIAAKGEMWSYNWWSYAEGGDTRYITRDIYLLAMEIGASCIGIACAYLLWKRSRSNRFTDGQLLVLMALMLWDWYPTYLYYIVEVLHGFPSVDTFADLIIKFIGANVYWLIMPIVVFIWAGRQLIGRRPA